MTLLVLSLVLVVVLAIRIGYVALQLCNMEGFWSDLDRRGLRFQIARAINLATTLAFFASSIHALWTLDATATGWFTRYATVFVAWFGISLLSKLSLHRFPRTNSSQFFREAQVTLIVHLVTAVISGLLMTGITAVYFWIRG